MIEHLPRFFFLIAWLILGPIHAHGLSAILTPTIIMLAISCLILAFIPKRSFQGRSIALLCILALMFYQSLELVVLGVHIELTHPDPVTQGIRHFFTYFFDVNLGLALVGVVAAFGVAAYVEFGRSRLPLSNLFPQLHFVEAPQHILQMVKNLAATAGVPTPHVYLIDSGAPSAFTTRSREGKVLAVSVGLLESLEPTEIEACLAHEISHLKNRDYILRFCATTAKVGLFARPLSYVIEPAIYRAREHLADCTASKLVGGPSALLSALSKIREAQHDATVPLASVGVACLFSSSPRSCLLGIFNKHPSLDARIRVLQEM